VRDVGDRSIGGAECSAVECFGKRIDRMGLQCNRTVPIRVVLMLSFWIIRQ
jgi:hypothetical protein